MKQVVIFIFSLLIAASGYTQDISNVQFEQKGKYIYISYNLNASPQKKYLINIYCKEEGDLSWGTSLKNVSGNVGSGQEAGINKVIIWDVLQEYNELKSEIEFKIEALPINEKYLTYYDKNLHFSFNYPERLKQLSDDIIQSINNNQFNQKFDISFNAGFSIDEEKLLPLVLIYVPKKMHSSDFEKIAGKFSANKINLSKVITLIKEANSSVQDIDLNKPVIDYEKKIIITTMYMEENDSNNTQKKRGLVAMFFGREKIIQINFFSYESDFNMYLKELFLPIIESFKFEEEFKLKDNNIIDSDPFKIPGQDFIAGFTSKYICDGSGKGRGVKFSIKYPHDWHSSEGNRPHIVRKFYNDDSSVQVMILINDLGETPTKEDINFLFNEENAKQLIPSGGHFIKSSSAVIEGEKTLVLDYSLKRDKLGMTINTRNRIYLIIYNTYMIQIQLGVYQPLTGMPNDLNEEFNKYELLFSLMVNSFSLISKWED